MLKSSAILFCAAISLAAQPAGQNANPAAEIRARYTKYDYRIPMRDGVKLFTSVYVPKDTSQPYPIMMERTPYSIGPYGIDRYPGRLGPSELFSKEGFIFVYQDVRGRYLSEGTFVDVSVHHTNLGPKQSDDATDTWDTIDWLVKNVPNNNGKVGIWGISYPGFYAAFSLIDSHPALKAVSPQAPMGDVGNGDDAYHNGAFYLAANFGFYTSFKPRGEPETPKASVRFDFGTEDEYDFYLRMGPLANAAALLKDRNIYWEDLLRHPNYDDFWQSRAQAPHMKGVKPAVLFVGGWFDAEDLSGPLKLFRATEAGGPASPVTLTMGPFRHGGWAGGDGQTLGNLDFASKAGEYFRNTIEFPFFMEHLKGKGNGLREKAGAANPQAFLFETGTDRWVRFAAWPPAEATAQRLYLDAGGKLSFSKPESSGFDEYTSDPAHPVPVIGDIGAGMPGDYMTYDQRFASQRPDVLTYQTPPLDHDVTISGPITASLRVSSSGTDSDFVVKLIDVYPDDYPDPQPNPRGVHMGGYQQLVRGEPMRGKFRNGFEKPEPFEPGKMTKVEFVMPDVLHTFRSGHRIMVHIQSTWFPLVDRNPQKFTDIYHASAADFQKATQRVYRTKASASGLKVSVME